MVCNHAQSTLLEMSSIEYCLGFLILVWLYMVALWYRFWFVSVMNLNELPYIKIVDSNGTTIH
jgi:hypothetical protein